MAEVTVEYTGPHADPDMDDRISDAAEENGAELLETGYFFPPISARVHYYETGRPEELIRTMQEIPRVHAYLRTDGDL